jgi:hypothetical protein
VKLALHSFSSYYFRFPRILLMVKSSWNPDTDDFLHYYFDPAATDVESGGGGAGMRNGATDDP